ncbi:hypothetical protein DL764_005084 [Monosporascus ibericus]|uniref:Uncharacterized protein n=1 Tax=Monosporascus ibericus TaxID=155417 RepID=A0A4V1XAQ1_9PEZI|nr:hypothetical protein DL764_005084 [Monosporascus ibericus]
MSPSPRPSPKHHRQCSPPIPRSPGPPSPSTQSMLPQQPLTATDWRRAVSEAKSKYLRRKYHACWTQCCALLDSVERAERQDSSPEPVYRIYLHFYAALSFDMGARALSASDPFRAQLLRDARAHYDRAAALIEAAEKAQNGRSVLASAPAPSNPHPNRNSNSRSNSNSDPNASSSLHSPTFSASGSSRNSITSTASEAASSPRTSLCSSLDGESSSASKPAENQQRNQQSTAAPPAKPMKRTKKVSFSGLPELSDVDIQKANASWRTADSYVRPDSPTLGWENHVSIVPCREPVLDSPTLPGLGFPALPDLDSPTLPDFGPVVAAAPSRSRSLLQRQRENQPRRASTRSRTTDLPPSSSSSPPTITPSAAATTSTPTPIIAAAAANDVAMAANTNAHNDNPSPGPHFDLDIFLQVRSQNRVCSQLSALQAQIRRHRDAVDGLLDAPDEISEAPCLPAAAEATVPTTFPQKGSVELGDSAAAMTIPETSRSEVGTETEARYTRRPSAAIAGNEETDSPPRSEPPAKEETEKPAEAQSNSREISPQRAVSPAPYSRRQSHLFNSHSRSGRPQPTINTNVNAMGRSSSISSASPTLYSPYSPSYSSSRPGTSTSFYPPPTTPGTPYSRPGTSMSTYSRPGSAASSTRGRDRDEALQQRIERLRAAGWQRKRFDGRRYEALREQVLGELGSPGA